jgi:hypothetical protein
VSKCKHDSVIRVVHLVPFLLLLAALPAVAADPQAPAAVQSAPPRSDLIRQLETAKKTDWVRPIVWPFGAFRYETRVTPKQI